MFAPKQYFMGGGGGGEGALGSAPLLFAMYPDKHT